MKWVSERFLFDICLRPFIKYARKIFRKINICNPLTRTRTCAYKGVRNVSFSEDDPFAAAKLKAVFLFL